MRVEALHRRRQIGEHERAPGDAERGEREAHGVRAQAAQRLEQQVHGYSIRSVSAGSTRAARQAGITPGRERDAREHAERERHDARREHRNRHEIRHLEARRTAAQPAMPSATPTSPPASAIAKVSTKNWSDDVAPPRADREPHADLLAPLVDGVEHHVEHADAADHRASRAASTNIRPCV